MREHALLVLDFDGTLVDLKLPRESLRNDIEAILKKEGFNVPLVPFLANLEDTLCQIEARDKAHGKNVRQQVWDIVNDADMTGARGVVARPGLDRFLSLVATHPIVIYSNNSVPSILEALRRLGVSENKFLKIYGRPGNQSLKPSGRPIIELYQQFAKENRNEVFMLGDHPFDIQSAKDASQLFRKEKSDVNVISVGRYRDSAHAVKLDHAGADFLVESLEEAATYFNTPPLERSISMVYLAFNEEKTILEALNDAHRFGRVYAPNYKVVIVNDGSQDETANLLKNQQSDRLTVITHQMNEGMGSSMRDGYAAVETDFMAHLAADRQVRASELVHFLKFVKDENVVTSFYLNPPSGFGRLILSVLFRLCVRWVGSMRVNFAGSYIFHRDWLSKINKANTQSKSFVYSFELLEEIKKAGANFSDVGIRTFPREIGKSSEVKLSRILKVFLEVCRSRLRRS